MQKQTIRRAARAIAALLIPATALMVMQPAGAAFSDVSMVASNNQVSATNVSYTMTFKVGAADAAIAVILPSGVGGLDTSNIAVATSSDGSTFTPVTPSSLLESADGLRAGINLPAAVTVGDYVRVTITGLTNPANVGEYTAKVGGKLTALTQLDLDAALDTLLGLLAEVADIVFNIVAVVSNGISTNVSVAPALNFSISSASHSWSLDPAGTASSTAQYDDLTLATNAASYVVQAYVSGDLVRVGTDGSSASDTIPHDGPANGPHFGYKVTGPAGDEVDAAQFRSFGTSAANLVNGWSLSGLTNGETIRVTYDVKIDYTKAPGTYTGSVVYRVVPTY